MKKILYILIGILLGLGATAFAATTVFKSNQLAPSPSNGKILQTDGTNSSWVTNSGSGTISTSTALTAGQVDFSTGVNTIGNDSQFYWDNTNKELGIGGTPGTAKLYVNGNVGIGSTTPGSLLAIGGDAVGINFSTATSTFSTSGGINLTKGGCFAISGVCIATGAGTVYSLNGLTTSAQTFATSSTNGGFGFTSSGSVHTLNIPTASASSLGLLSLTDWSTFNNKQTSSLAKGNFLVGNDAGVAQATSSIFVSSTGNVGIGSTTPGATLSVKGSGTTGATNSLIVTDSNNISLLTIGNSGNIALSNGASAGGTSGAIAIGTNAVTSASGAVAIGNGSNSSNSGAFALGNSAAASGAQSIALGYTAGAAGDQSTAVGHGASANGTDSIAIGSRSYVGFNSQSSAIGFSVQSGANNNMVLGAGLSDGTRMVFSQSNAIGIGIGSTIPTMVITGGSGANTVGNVGIGSTTPGSLLAIGGDAVGINFSTATSTFSTSGGINLTKGGCFAVNGVCITGTGGTGTVTSVATDSTLTGGTITTTGTLGLNLANSNTWTATTTGLSFQIGSTARDNALTVIPTRVYPASISTGGAMNCDEVSLAQFPCLVLHGNSGSAGTGRLFVINQEGTATTQDMILASSSCLNCTALNIKGQPTGKGILKIEHTGNGTGFSNSSMISLDGGNATDSQGIFMDWTTAATTGNLLNLKNGGNTKLTLSGGGLLTFANSSSTAYSTFQTSSSTFATIGTLQNRADFSSATVKLHTYASFAYSTSTTWTATTTIQVSIAYTPELWSGIKCHTNTGTLNVDAYHTSTHLALLNASTTIGHFTWGSNNSANADEIWWVDIGTPASSPTSITCAVDKIVNN